MASCVALIWSLNSVGVPHGTLAVSAEDIRALRYKHHEESLVRLGYGTKPTEDVTSHSDKGCRTCLSVLVQRPLPRRSLSPGLAFACHQL